jgi:hypothetical protein
LELTQMELLFSHRAPITLPMDRQRDLTAALADLLLNAATVECDKPTKPLGRTTINDPGIGCGRALIILGRTRCRPRLGALQLQTWKDPVVAFWARRSSAPLQKKSDQHRN